MPLAEGMYTHVRFNHSFQAFCTLPYASLLASDRIGHSQRVQTSDAPLIPQAYKLLNKTASKKSFHKMLKIINTCKVLLSRQASKPVPSPKKTEQPSLVDLCALQPRRVHSFLTLQTHPKSVLAINGSAAHICTLRTRLTASARGFAAYIPLSLSMVVPMRIPLHPDSTFAFCFC